MNGRSEADTESRCRIRSTRDCRRQNIDIDRSAAVLKQRLEREIQQTDIDRLGALIQRLGSAQTRINIDRTSGALTLRLSISERADRYRQVSDTERRRQFGVLIQRDS